MGPLTVGEAATLAGLSPRTLRFALSALRRAGLVVERPVLRDLRRKLLVACPRGVGAARIGFRSRYQGVTIKYPGPNRNHGTWQTLMMQPSELLVAKLLPTIRARLAQVLLENYKMKQIEVAKALGITQAAVSHYNTRARGLDQDIVRRFPEIDEFVAGLAKKIHGGLGQTEQIALVNAFSLSLMATQRFCDYHKRTASLDPNCSVCFSEPPRP